MQAQNVSQVGENPRTVIRGWNSQEVGLHWMRNSFLRQLLGQVRSYCDIYFGESVEDDRPMNSYDLRYYWPNGVSLCYDSSLDRSEKRHKGYISLDVPGQVLDDLDGVQLKNFCFGLRKYEPKATRLDVFYDDYERLVTPSKLHRIIKKHDYSGFRKGGIIQVFKGEKLIQDEIFFGARGKKGSGKYMRIYDKALETNGRKNCIRYEVEFTKERAKEGFDLLCQMGSVESLAQLCGNLVTGVMDFVHRTGEKNIVRLKQYNFWSKIKEFLGSVVIRVPVKRSTIAAMFRFIERQAMCTMAVLRRTFVTDVDFMNWSFDNLTKAELRLSQQQINLIKANTRSTRYDDGLIFDSERWNDGITY